MTRVACHERPAAVLEREDVGGEWYGGIALVKALASGADESVPHASARGKLVLQLCRDGRTPSSRAGVAGEQVDGAVSAKKGDRGCAQEAAGGGAPTPTMREGRRVEPVARGEVEALNGIARWCIFWRSGHDPACKADAITAQGCRAHCASERAEVVCRASERQRRVDGGAIPIDSKHVDSAVKISKERHIANGRDAGVHRRRVRMRARPLAGLTIVKVYGDLGRGVDVSGSKGRVAAREAGARDGKRARSQGLGRGGCAGAKVCGCRMCASCQSPVCAQRAPAAYRSLPTPKAFRLLLLWLS